MLQEIPGKTVPEIFQANCKKYGSKACVADKDGATGAFMDRSWDEMNSMVRRVASYLLSQSVKPGDRVALFSPNRYEWWVADLAVLSQDIFTIDPMEILNTRVLGTLTAGRFVWRSESLSS